MASAQGMTARPDRGLRMGWNGPPNQRSGAWHGHMHEQDRLRALGLDRASDHELALEVTIEGLPDHACAAVLKTFPGAQRFNLS